jgi:hypothetical protein
MLVFISSNKWFRAAYGANLRKHVADTCRVHSITDFGELPVFEGAATFPMIFVAQKVTSTDRETQYTQVKSLEPPYPDVLTVIREQGKILPSDALNGDDWTLTDARSAARLRKMEASGIPLAEYVKGQICYGVKTGFNEAFVIEETKRNELIKKDPKSEEIIKPLAVGDDIRKWRIDFQNRWLIFTRRGINIDAYPAIKAHLSKWKANLTPKKVSKEKKPKTADKNKEEKGRKPGSYKWYEIQDDVAYFAEFNKPKIIYPVIGKEPRFAFDRKGAFTNDKAFIIPNADLFLLGVLNSEAVWNYLKIKCSSLGDADDGGRLELRAIYMEKVPIPNASARDRSTIATLVQKCLDAEGVGCDKWECEINERVAKLYGLEPGDRT